MNGRPNPYKINIVSNKTTSSITKFSEDSPAYSLADIPKEEPVQEVVDNFKNNVSSFWTFNVDFLDLPPISFDEPGSGSWSQIIKENIFQPFLPKNRLILQHFIKTFKQEDDMYKSQQTNKSSTLLGLNDPESPIRRMSFRITGDSSMAEHIGKFLNEVKKKMERKNTLSVKKVSKASKFVSRSLKNCDNIIRKRRVLEEALSGKNLVGHKLYELNLSHPEIRKEHDYFKIFDIDAPEECPKPSSSQTNLNNPRRNNETVTPSLKFIHSGSGITPGLRSENSLQVNLPKSNKQSGLRKMFRRKSCCCSECGGLSAIEKHTAKLIPEQGETVTQQKVINEGINYLKSDSLQSRGKERGSRPSRMVKEDSYKSVKLAKDSSLGVDIDITKRRKSYMVEPGNFMPRRPSAMGEHKTARNPSAKSPLNLAEPLNQIIEQDDNTYSRSTIKHNYSPFRITIPTVADSAQIDSPDKLTSTDRRKSSQKVVSKPELRGLESPIMPVKSLHSLRNINLASPIYNFADQPFTSKKPTLHVITPEKQVLPSLHNLNKNPSISEKFSPTKPTKKNLLVRIGSMTLKTERDYSHEFNDGMPYQNRGQKVRNGHKSVSTYLVSPSNGLPLLADLKSKSPGKPGGRTAKKSKTTKPVFHNKKEINKVYITSQPKAKTVIPVPPPNRKPKLHVTTINTTRDKSSDISLLSPFKSKTYIKSADTPEIKSLSTRTADVSSRLETWS